ncbi:iron complex transport system substrate-binding protein [Acetoanaerobium pronyense]|uniref:Iron complex transport system substrate-binding protein n=1 Tax=Acetoanaerobium pronyense TaxID=1482736 RepID=A0ABS4KJJ5_9FIRM|nr:ABC transporter substrate-binding protein [Acetoanaerobium pronyense]MBP2026809.1 iron complex transport system substrate-binding protein [Acetoanaerobium pronyense]
MRKNLLLSFIFLFSVVFLSGCQNVNSENSEIREIESGYPMTIVDSYGRAVELETEPQRVISIAPSITEIIYSIDAQEKLVGRTDFCDYPEDVIEIESIGSLTDPSIEKIMEINPDIVIASTHFKEDVLKKMEELGIKVLILYGPESFEGVYETVEKVGAILNKEENAKTVVNQMKEKVEYVTSRVQGREKPSVYYVVGYGEFGDYTATGETFISKMIEMAGGSNAADDAQGWKYSIEKVLEKDPDILICSKYFDTKTGIENANGYSQLTAVKEGRLFEIDNNKLDRQGTRLADGLEELAKLIHPDAF